MRKFFSLILVLLTILPVMAFADDVMPCYNPEDNVDNPSTLPYPANGTNHFNIKEGTATKAIAGPSDTNITVSLTNAYLDMSGSRTASLKIYVYYRNSGGGWSLASSKTISVSTTSSNYSVTMTVPANRTIYVEFSKTDYTNYYVRSDFKITD